MWWKVNDPRFPFLVEMVHDVLVIPISSVASLCAFSTRGRVLDPFRSLLTPKIVQSLICVQDCLISESFTINIVKNLEYLEQLELGKNLIFVLTILKIILLLAFLNN